jgi:uncharacterized protein YcbX
LVASTASLEELNARLQAKGQASVDMRRFRANVVLGPADATAAPADGQPSSALSLNAHDEDRIGTLTIHTQADAPGTGVQLQPVKPCPRGPIPNIDPDSAQEVNIFNFQKNGRSSPAVFLCPDFLMIL